MTMKSNQIPVQTRLKLAKAIAWVICVITLVSGLGVCIWIETHSSKIDAHHDAPQTPKVSVQGGLSSSPATTNDR